MKKGSCTFFPGCPPCFGLCGTEYAPYDLEDNEPCDGCTTCKAEKTKEITKNNPLLTGYGPLTNNPCKECNCCKIDNVHKSSMLDEEGRPGCFGMHTFPFACDDGGRKACPHCKKRQIEVPG